MNTIKKMIASAMALAGFATTANAQTGTATAFAEIVAPITVSATQNLQFGKVVGFDAGWVTVAPTGARTANIVLPSNQIAPAQATFSLSGLPNANFAIVLPPFAYIYSGTNNMLVNGFTSNNTNQLDGGGKGTLHVGATLNVGANQPVGNYAGTFNVSVYYN